MRTSFHISPSLVNEAKALGKAKTKTQAVILALTEFIQKRRSQKILELKGSLKKDFDYKPFRKSRAFP